MTDFFIFNNFKFVYRFYYNKVGINIIGGVMKKNTKLLLLLIVLIAGFILFLFVKKDEVSFMFLDESNNEVNLTLKKPFYKKYYNEVEISDEKNTKTQIFKNKMTLNIWKVDSGRINGKNNFDILFGVYNISPHHRDYSKRVFIYNIVDLKLRPKFRCSRLVTPMVDFSVYDWDNDGYEEILSIEKYNGKFSFNVYIQYDYNIERIYTKKLDFTPTAFKKKDKKIFILSKEGEKEIYFKNKEVFFK